MCPCLLSIHHHDHQGNLLWSLQLDDMWVNGNGLSWVNDGTSSLFVVGRFMAASITLGGITLTNTDPSASTTDIVAVRLSASDGSIQWAKRYLIVSINDQRALCSPLSHSTGRPLCLILILSSRRSLPFFCPLLSCPCTCSFGQSSLDDKVYATTAGTVMYVVGALPGTIAFDSITVTPTQADNAFVAQLNATDGSVLWVTRSVSQSAWLWLCTYMCVVNSILLGCLLA